MDIDLEGVLAVHQVDDLKGVLEDAHGHELLAVVAAVHHQRVGDALDDGALSLAEPLGRVPAGRVRQKSGILLFHSQVILSRI